MQNELVILGSTGSNSPDPFPSQGVNLLRFRWIAAIIRSPFFPYALQACLLAFFLFMAIFAWGKYPPPGVSDKFYAQSNLVNLLIWGLWWPAMVWMAVLWGRVWCAICPLELLSNLSERLGRLLGVKQRVLSKFLRSGALIVALYGFIQMMVAGVHLHRVPAYTSVFLWSLLTGAALVGFFFKDRAFCRGFCPVGLLLGTYGRGAMLAVRPDSASHGEGCEAGDCAVAHLHSHPHGRPCPSLLNPAKLNSSADCLICGHCIKVCHPANMGLFLRRPFYAANAREPLASWPVTLFVMLVSGFVVAELCSEWPTARGWFGRVPEELTAWLGRPDFGGWLEGVWTLFLVPALVWSIMGALVLLGRGAPSLTQAWRRLALPLAVLISAGHMSKGLAKFTSWIGFLPLALQDPGGVDTAKQLTTKAIPQPVHLLPMSVISIMALGLVLTGAYFAMRELRLSQPEGSRRMQAPILVLAACFAFVVFGWGFLL